MPTRAERKQRTRAAIIDAAVAVLTEEGYVAATVDRIAERAGMTRGAVYANFSGKRALVLAATAQLVEGLPKVSVTPGKTAGEVLRAMVLSVGEPSAEHSAPSGTYEQDLQAAYHESAALRSASGGIFDLQTLLLARTLERLEAGRGGASHSQVPVAQAVILLLQGWQTRLLYGGPPPPVSRLAAAAAVLAGLTPGVLESVEPPARQPLLSAEIAPQPWAPPPHDDLVTGRPLDPEDAATVGLVVRASVAQLGQALTWSRALSRADPDTRLLLLLDDLGDDEVDPLARLTIRAFSRMLHAAAPPASLPDVGVVIEDAEGSFGASLGLELRPALASARLRQGRVTARAIGDGAPVAVLDI